MKATPGNRITAAIAGITGLTLSMAALGQAPSLEKIHAVQGTGSTVAITVPVQV